MELKVRDVLLLVQILCNTTTDFEVSQFLRRIFAANCVICCRCQPSSSALTVTQTTSRIRMLTRRVEVTTSTWATPCQPRVAVTRASGTRSPCRESVDHHSKQLSDFLLHLPEWRRLLRAQCGLRHGKRPDQVWRELEKFCFLPSNCTQFLTFIMGV